MFVFVYLKVHLAQQKLHVVGHVLLMVVSTVYRQLVRGTSIQHFITSPYQMSCCHRVFIPLESVTFKHHASSLAFRSTNGLVTIKVTFQYYIYYL